VRIHTSLRFAVTAAAMLLATQAHATFHLMQIEQVTGGANGDKTIQEIQLRMRSLGQNLVSQARVNVYDANGANPILVKNMTTNVANGATGSRVLLGTAAFAANIGIPLDFTFTSSIPDAYLSAGSLTYEDDFEGILLRLSWGGANYLGPQDGDITNDVDGAFGVYSGPCPTVDLQGLRFTGAATAPSTDNQTDYALTGGAATFTNNAGTSGTVTAPLSVPTPRPTTLALSAPVPNPVRGIATYSIDLPDDSPVRVRMIDASGRIARTLVDESLGAGRHVFAIDASSKGTLAPGLYFLDLEAAGRHQSRRVAVVQ